MPKLNVQQNNKNVIQAFKNALAIGNLKGIIASDGNHNFSTAGSNRNLLDNPWFTVRQRGDGPFASAGYTVDRWCNMNSSATTTPTSDGLTLTVDNTGGLRQYIESDLNAFLIGKTVTFSILYQDGTIGAWTFEWSASHSNRGTKYNTTIYAGGTNGISINRSATIYIRAVKLELGSVSTLANDAPPEYAEELAKCQYYFRRLKNTLGSGWCFGVGVASTASVVDMIVHANMRLAASPTIAYSGSFTCNGNAVTSMSIWLQGGQFCIRFITSGLTTYSAVQVFANARSYIDISADL